MNYTNNEFKPSTWMLYTPKTIIPEFPNLIFISFFPMFGAVIILLKRKFRGASIRSIEERKIILDEKQKF